MRVYDNILSLTLERLEAMVSVEPNGDGRGPYLGTSGTRAVRGKDLLDALKELQSRRAQDAWVTRQMLEDG